MLSNIDKLLLTSAQQAEMERMKRAYLTAEAAGDSAAMKAAHDRAEALRAQAGYSGGAGGDRFELLRAANAPAGYNAYEAILQEPLNTGMQAIAAGYAERTAALEAEETRAEAQEEARQAAARSAAWSARRLAGDGLLTRGFAHTGMADVVTATALNQAAANAYQALLERREAEADRENQKAEAKADALGDAAELQETFGKELAKGYSGFFELEHELERMAKDYYYELALQQLKLKSK